MKIAFDLDNTLIRCGYDFPLEPERFTLLRKMMGFEQVRMGTKELLQYLKQQNHQIWIYTSSFRNPYLVKLSFLLLGTPVHSVITQKEHIKKIKKLGINCSKYPPAFQLHVLIDDSPGVQMEGNHFGFRVIQVQPEDKDWVAKIKREIVTFRAE